MSSRLMVAVVAAGIFWASQAYADDTTDDVRCLVISLSVAGNQNSGIQIAGTIAVMYWMGRLDGRTPDLDMENRLIDEISAMTPDGFQAEATRCGKILQARGKTMSDMGHEIQEKSKALQQQENSR